MNATHAYQHISPSGIAKLAGVSTSTVSNWRTRYPDFPQATAGTQKRPLFPLPAVLQWLEAKNKPIKQDPDQADFALLSSLRGIVPAEDMVPMLLPLLWWAKWSQDPETRLPDYALFPLDPSVTGPIEPLSYAAKASSYINEYLSDGLYRVYEWLYELPSPSQQMLEHIGAALGNADPRRVAEQLIKADAERARGGLAATMTSPAVSQLLVRSVGEHAATIADLACGAGQTLLDAHRTHPHAQLYGNDPNKAALEIAACRLFLADAPVELSAQDALTIDSTFDAVLMHGPSGMLHGEQKARAAQLPFGGVTGSRSDLAWALVAYRALNPNGRAAVVLPQRALSRAGSSSQVLSWMIAEGVIEAIISLPASIQRYTKTPSYLLVLHRPTEPATPNEVLLIDLSQHSAAAITETVIDETITTLNTWRTGEPIQHPKAIPVPATKLLSPDASLAPQAWLQMVQPVDDQDLLEKAQQAQAQLKDAERALQALTIPSAAFQALDTAVETYPIGNAFPAHRGTAQTHRTDTDPDAEPVDVLTPHAMDTGRPERVPITMPDSPYAAVTTRAGQVAVTIRNGGIFARVWEIEGLPVSRGVTVLDINPATHDPEFVAQMLMAEVNQATLSGQLTPTIKLEKMRLPRLPLDAQRRAGATYKQLRLATEAATQLAHNAQALLTAASNTVATGQFTLH
ncbi:class I SAM-dependent DNA methyltransferase [Kocuria rhizosphaericola]|uniref:HsdM family class I SAM-dependent methyltransferase n=1 Tax=Kocuria rhizosphaericola TaxID=3376284 RepID=UPI0037AFB8CE